MDTYTKDAIDALRKIADELEAGDARVQMTSVDVSLTMVRKNVEIRRPCGGAALSWDCR